jgi:membrane complex biogenesis BtpA family protein
VGHATDILGSAKALVGMIHAGALPGTPRSRDPVGAIAARAVEEARIYVEAGFDALIVENMHDVPYLRRDVGPEIVAAMTAVTSAVVAEAGLPVGVQILAGANRAALAVAHATGAAFIRAEGFVYATIADEGLLDEADAGPLLRERKRLGAEGVAILADVKKKHSSHALTADVSIAEEARTAAFCGADGVIVTGTATGRPTDPADVRDVAEAVDVPVLIGSGVTPEQVPALLEHADALIVGTWCKRDGDWTAPVDAERARAIVAARG